MRNPGMTFFGACVVFSALIIVLVLAGCTVRGVSTYQKCIQCGVEVK